MVWEPGAAGNPAQAYDKVGTDEKHRDRVPAKAGNGGCELAAVADNGSKLLPRHRWCDHAMHKR